MIGRLLAKLGVTSSTITGVVYLDVTTNNSARLRGKQETKQAIENLQTIEDVELFERMHECNFVFVNSWVNKDLYSARAFDEKKKDPKWRESILGILNKIEANKKNAKDYCKEQKGVITLFDNQEKKAFWLGEPQGGWNT